MSDTKVLQSILDKVNQIDENVKTVDNKVDKLTERVDKLGLQLAFLEDDTPTRAEHEKLKKRVKKIELKLASA